MASCRSLLEESEKIQRYPDLPGLDTAFVYSCIMSGFQSARLINPASLHRLKFAGFGFT
jgi:hypothetical protein